MKLKAPPYSDNSKLPDDERLVTVPPERLASLRLSPSAREYLSEAGLPKACGSCLSFEEGHLPQARRAESL